MELKKFEYLPMAYITSDSEYVNPEWLEVWERMDALDEGRISLKALENFILNTKYADELRPEAATALLLKADLDKDGFISKQEFLYLVRKSRKSPKATRFLRSLTFLSIPKSGRNARVRKYIDEYSCLPPPVFTLGILAAQISIYIYYAITMGDFSISGPSPVDSPLIYNPCRRYEAWRFFTYLFIHIGWLHLLLNVIMQLVFGIVLELVHKWYRVSLVYILGVIGGCLASSLATPSFYLAGASGGVYALEYAYIGNLIMNWSEMTYPIAQAVALGSVCVMDVTFAVFDTYKNSDSVTPTSHITHLGGAIVGMLVGVNILRNLEKLYWEKYCWWTSFVVLIVLFGAAVTVHFAVPGYFPPADYTPL